MDLKNKILDILKEATSENGSRGSYSLPMQPGFRKFKKTQLGPFTDQVSKYNNAELNYDSLDGHMDEPKNKIKKMEKKSNKISNYKKNHPTTSDDDGDVLNPFPSKINEWVEIIDESDSSTTAGLYNGPVEIGMKKWRESELGPYKEFVNTNVNKKKSKSKLKNNIEKTIGMWEKGKDGTYEIETHDTHTIKEDLGVWFGTKKKPKGSKQPKGPWVNICRKKEGGGHPPCGRPDADSKGYPKCRAAGVASKMTDAQKRSACQQKRKAEKSNPKSGTGNSPTMVSYKPKKQNEQIKLTESQIKRLINTVLNNGL
jgi:hypothetical protein